MMAEDNTLTLAQLEDLDKNEPGPGPESIRESLAAALGSEQDDKSAEEQDEGRPRDEKGRFASRKADEGEGDTEKPKPEKPAADAQKGEEGEPKAAADGEHDAEGAKADDHDDDPIEPPVDWSLEEQNHFRELPKPAQQFVRDRVGAAAKASEEAQTLAQRYKAIDEVIAPRRDAFARSGMDDTAVIKQLFALSDFANQQPVEFLRYFMQQNRIAPEQVFGQRQAAPAEGEPQPEGPPDPRYTALERELQAIKAREQQRTQEAERARQAQEAEQAKAVDNQILAFSSEKDDKGGLKHPYFNQVRTHMGALMDKGLASDLNTAYDMACRADPEVSAKIAAAAEAARKRELDREARKKAEAAGKAGSSVSGSSGAEPAAPTDLRESLRHELSRQRGGAMI